MYNDFRPKELVTLIKQSFHLSLNAIKIKDQAFLTKELWNV